ncbi:SRPBCC family protein [Dactylosporangium sp. CA-092794]|uniref:SRPBCC family protein n=1 Tax=Dactylosporangium sp. CA-092794 TaxID=3239929 RepID=UPI003D90BF9A
MPRIEFDLTTPVAPDRFIAALTDFSPARADLWPNVDLEHLKVHEVGPDSADVTEGSSLAGGVWERNRYDWSAPGTVRVETIESNTWRPGSSWLYQVEPAGTGSHIRVTVDRRPATLRGQLVSALLLVAGRRALRGATEQVLRKLAAQ